MEHNSLIGTFQNYKYIQWPEDGTFSFGFISLMKKKEQSFLRPMHFGKFVLKVGIDLYRF